MNDSSPAPPTVPRWLHGWSLVTVIVALPLIALGAEVTTKQVGMADQQAVREPWYLITLPKDQLWAQGVGLVIEHSHRTAGWLVGICSIVLAIGMWVSARGTGVRAAGLLALILVIAQGLLGIFRVRLNAWMGPEMALVHGLFAQIVFATLVAVAVVTSRSWRREPSVDLRGGLRWPGALLAVATAGQIVFGALVRHQHSPVAQRLHVLFAFAIVAVIVWLVREAQMEPVDRPIRRVAWLLVGLVSIQVALGVEAWLRRFGAGVPVELLQANAASDLLRSAHFLVGALLFATTVSVNLLLYRPASAADSARVTAFQDSLFSGGRITARIGGTL
jgi:heme A synthase